MWETFHLNWNCKFYYNYTVVFLFKLMLAFDASDFTHGNSTTTMDWTTKWISVQQLTSERPNL